MSWSWSSKKAPDHHTNTTMFDSCFDQSIEYFPKLLFPFWSAVIFLLGTMDAISAQSLSYCWTMNSDFNWLKWSQHLDYVMGSFVTSCMSHQLVDSDSSFPSINKNCHFKTVFSIYLFDDLNPVLNMWKEERNREGANIFSQHCIGNKRVNIGRLANTGRKQIVLSNRCLQHKHRNRKPSVIGLF